jgi:U3 small nucleolar RNA-associated protein 13
MRIYAVGPSDTDEETLELELLRTLRPHTSPVVTLAIDRTGTLVGTGGADGVVKVWDIRAGYTTHTFHGHGGVVSALHFFEVEVAQQEDASENSKKRKRRKSQQEEQAVDDVGDHSIEFRLASGAEDGKIRVWDLHKRKSAAVLDSHVSVVRSLQYSATAQMLISGSRDQTLILWSADRWKPSRTIAAMEGVESAGFIEHGQIIYSGGEHGRIRLWSVATGREITQEQEAGFETESIVHVLHHAALPYLISVHADQVLNFHTLPGQQALEGEETIEPLHIFRRVSGTKSSIWLTLAETDR